jgi:hypothetical protein
MRALFAAITGAFFAALRPRGEPRRQEPGESATVPGDHGRRLHDRERVGPSRPHSGDDDPERPVGGAKRWPRPGAVENGELLPEHEDLYDEARAGPNGVDERAEQGRDDRKHRPGRDADRGSRHGGIAAGD